MTDGRRPVTVRHKVANLDSISHLVPLGRRAGIYVLHFDNGQRYVGRSVDVVDRFSDHRRRWNDITNLFFVEVSPVEQPVAEHTVIRAQERDGFDLRNIAGAAGSLLGQSPLDSTVSASDQESWLSTGVVPNGDCERCIDQAQRARFADQAAELMAWEDGHLVEFVFAGYMMAAIPRAAETERTFWTASALPNTSKMPGIRRVAALTAHITEAVWAVVDTTASQWSSPAFYFNVAASVLETETGLTVEELSGLKGWPVIYRADYAAGDIATIGFTIDDVENDVLLRVPWEDAARVHVLRSFRKGRTMQGRWHNYDFATALFTEINALVTAPLDVPQRFEGQPTLMNRPDIDNAMEHE